jgi:hypothetical protein
MILVMKFIDKPLQPKDTITMVLEVTGSYKGF